MGTHIIMDLLKFVLRVSGLEHALTVTIPIGKHTDTSVINWDTHVSTILEECCYCTDSILPTICMHA